MKTTLVVLIVLGSSGAVWALPDPDTFSIDAISPSLFDPADLLNPGISVQVPKVNLGLGVGDELDALSSGDDAVQWSNIVFFSVDRLSLGIQGPFAPLDVFGQAALNQQAGDVFVTTDPLGVWTPPQNINSLQTNQNAYGEIPVIGPLVNNAGNPQDNMDGLSFDEFDWNGDGITDQATFFSLAAGSPSLGGLSPADILISPTGSGGFHVFALAAQMGLMIDDDLDALALLDLDQDGLASAGDLALFSLAPGSPTLGALGSPADVFLTPFDGTSAVRYNAGLLGLLAEDNVDALEVQVPEPATMGLLLLGGAAMLTRRTRRRRT